MANESAWKDLGPAAEAAWARYPVKYDAPEWQNLARAMAKKHKVPEDIVLGVLLRGEATNADKVSSKGARGPFQFIPGTRAKFIENKGIDPWLSPENNAEAAVLHLKESLERNKNRPEFDRKYLAVAEYTGGPDWMMPRDVKLKGGGVYKYRPKEATDYADRVFEIAPSKRGSYQKQEQSPALVAGPTPAAMAGAAGEPEIPLTDEERRLEDVRSQFRQFTEQGAASDDKEFKAYALYAKGQMTPEVRQQYEEGVKSGAIKLPSGVKELKFGLAAKQEGKRGAIDAGPRTMLRYQAALDNDPYVSDRFTDEEMMRFEDQVRRGLVKVPDGFPLRKTAEPGFIDKIIESASGKKRATAETTTAKDWWDLPEIDADKIGYIAKMALIGASPDEAVNMIRSLAPQVKIDTDQRGNVIFESAADPGGKYAIKPGWEPSDTARLAARMVVAAPAAAIGAAAAPAVGLGGLVGLAAGGAAGAGLEEAAFQAAQGATPGGEFNASDVAISAAFGGAVPAVGVPAGRAIGAVAKRAAALPVVAPAVGAVRRAAGTAEQAVRGAGVAATEAVAERVRPMALAAQMAQAAPAPVPRPPVAVVSRMEQATAPMVEQRLSAMRAAPPGMGAARALPPAPEAADFREAMMRFRQVQAEMPPKLPNAGRLTSVQADEILPLMQRYRDAAEAVGNTQSVRIADEYLARARASMAQPAAVARAQAAPLVAEPRVFARAKVEPLKQAIKQAAPYVPEQAADDVAQLAVKAKRSAGEDITDDELVQLVADTAKKGTVGQAAKLKLADMMQLNAEDMVKARLYGFDVPDEFFIDNKRMRALAGLEASQVGTQAEAQLNATVSDALSRSDDILKRFDAVYAEGGPALGAVSDRIGKAMVVERETIRQEAAPIYKMVDAAMENKAVRLDNVRNYFANKLKGASRKVLSKDEKKLLDLIETSYYQKYGDLVAIKNNITSALEKRSGPYKNMADKTLIDLKNAITADQLDNVGSKRIMGEQAEEMRRALRKAHLLTAKQKAFERRLTTLFGKEFQDGMPLGDIEGAIVSALRAPSAGGGIGQLRKLMAKIPEDMKREALATGFAAAVQRRGGKEAAESGISPAAFITVKNAIDKSTFADEFYRTLGPGSKEALGVVHSVMERLWLATGRELKQTGKALQKSLDDSMAAKAVNRMIAETTARQALGVAGSAGGKVLATALGAGEVGRSVGATTGAALANNLMDAITGTRALSKQFINVLHSDEFKKMMVASATGKPLDEPAKAVANSPQFIMYANEMGVDQTPKARLSFIKRLFAVSPGAIKEAPMRAAATEAARMGMEESTVPTE